MKEVRDTLLKDKKSFLRTLKTITVVGAGVSGISLVSLIKKLGKKAKLTELANDLSEDRLELLRAQDVPIEFGCHSRDFLKDSDLIVLSPGIDSQFFKNRYLSFLDIPCVGEIEFSYWFCKSKNLVAITGTNGKTSTTYIIGDILTQNTGHKVHILGNIGEPFCSQVLSIQEDDYVVLEISSFQLETILTFKPYIACLLNISEDHLDRYPNVVSYLKAKKQIFINQDNSCFALFGQSLSEQLKDIKAQKIIIEDEDNASFVKKTVSLLGVNEDLVDACLKDFKGLPHRLEYITEKNGISFVNDSKATNVSATAFALRKIKRPLLLIAGGRDKGLNYSLLKPYLGNVKSIFLIGEAKAKIKEALQDSVPITECASLRDAVSAAYKKAESKDAVLLSPMCASFDMFRDYKERGDVFREAVDKLPLK